MLPPLLREVEISFSLGDVSRDAATIFFCCCVGVISVQQHVSEPFAVPANENVPQNSCDHQKRDKLRDTFHSVTEALSSLVGSMRSVFGRLEIVWRNSI